MKSLQCQRFPQLNFRAAVSPSHRRCRPIPPSQVCPGVGGFRRHSGCSRRPGRRGGRLVARPALERTTQLNREVLLHKIELDRLKDLRRKPPRRQTSGGIRVTFNSSRDSRGSGISCRCLSCPSGVFSAESKSAEVTAGVRLRLREWHHLRGASRKVSRGGLAAPMVWPVSPVSEGGRQRVLRPASAGGRVFGLAIKQI